MSRRQVGSLEEELQAVASSRDTWQVRGIPEFECVVQMLGPPCHVDNPSTHLINLIVLINVELSHFIFCVKGSAKQHEKKLIELTSSSLGHQADLGRSRAEAQSSAAQSQVSKFKAKHIESELQVGRGIGGLIGGSQVESELQMEGGGSFRWRSRLVRLGEAKLASLVCFYHPISLGGT